MYLFWPDLAAGHYALETISFLGGCVNARGHMRVIRLQRASAALSKGFLGNPIARNVYRSVGGNS